MDFKGNSGKLKIETRYAAIRGQIRIRHKKGQHMQKKETKITIPEDTRLISFLGGKTIIYILSALILIGILIFTMDTISFIFKPLQIMFSTVVAPVILAIVFYYIFNPLVTFLEWRHRSSSSSSFLCWSTDLCFWFRFYRIS